MLRPHSGTRSAPLKIALGGLGAIGIAVARAIKNGDIPNTELVAVSVRDKAKARAALDAIGCPAPVVDLPELHQQADIVVECAPAAVFEAIVRPALMAGKTVIVLSAGALLSYPDLTDLAAKHGGQIMVPSGALLGLDAVSAAAQGKIHSVKMMTRKPIEGLLGAPYLVKNNIEIRNIDKPTRVFSGNAREAAIGFPANLNVAVALSLAGIGPDRTELEIWADPTVTRNTHTIIVDADSARLEMKVENVPSENPKTGRLTPLSVISTLKKISAPLRVG